jgi:hypothetical protein
VGRVSKDVLERYEADKEQAAGYRERLDAAAAAEHALRTAQAEGGRSDAELRGLAKALDDALLGALRAAEAAERVEMGTKTYGGEDPAHARAADIARRKAKAKAGVRPWTDEVDRLRTARETNKLSYRAVARV